MIRKCSIQIHKYYKTKNQNNILRHSLGGFDRFDMGLGDKRLEAKSLDYWVSGQCSGDSANAVPPTKKLRTRVTRIWGDRRGQPNRSAMERPRSGPIAVEIAIQPVPGKYAFFSEKNWKKSVQISKLPMEPNLHLRQERLLKDIFSFPQIIDRHANLCGKTVTKN